MRFQAKCANAKALANRMIHWVLDVSIDGCGRATASAEGLGVRAHYRFPRSSAPYPVVMARWWRRPHVTELLAYPAGVEPATHSFGDCSLPIGLGHKCRSLRWATGLAGFIGGPAVYILPRVVV